MNEWYHDNLIYAAVAGSVSYGLSTEKSDLDAKGIVIPPLVIRQNLFENFSQFSNDEGFNKLFASRINPQNPKIESTVYGLSKFILLAFQNNPNILEMLFIDPIDIVKLDHAGKILLDAKNKFLSKKAFHTFNGYMYAQISKIERHRKWLACGEMKKPDRLDFGLKEIPEPCVNEAFKTAQRTIDLWILNSFPIDEECKKQISETIWECFANLHNTYINWGNWPEVYTNAALNKIVNDLGLSEEFRVLLQKESEYRVAQKQYMSWVSWKTGRNKERSELEQKFGWDVKHGMHLLRLGMSCIEILKDGNLTVRKNNDDKKLLLSVRRGELSYEEVVKISDTIKKECEELYKKSNLQNTAPKEVINDLYLHILDCFKS